MVGLHPALAATNAARNRRRLRALRFWTELVTAFVALIQPAQGAPLALLFSGFATGLGLGGAGIGFTASAFGIGVAAGQFLAANWLYVAAIGAAALLGAINQNQSQTAQPVNVKLDVGFRRHAMGTVLVGGQAIFGKFDADGAWWQLVVHADEEVARPPQVRFDNIAVTIDADNLVQTDDFKAWSGGILGQLQQLKPFYALWVLTWSPDHVLPAIPGAFTAAIAEWTANHKAAGITLSLMRIAPVSKDQLPQVYKWQQGAFGNLAGPGVSLIGTFGRLHDPRDGSSDRDRPASWAVSAARNGNIVLMLAWNRYRLHGFETPTPMDGFNWDHVGSEADVCDETVIDKNGHAAPRYAGGLTFDDSVSAGDIEKKLLAACDGMLVTDDDGKLWFRVGRYYEPTVSVLTARDQLGVDSVVIEDGESELDGVQVIYTEPDYDYQLVPAAPYLNPRYYVPGTAPRLKQVTIDAIQNHNHAVRIEKAIAELSQPANKLSQNVGPIALDLTGERIFRGDYDEFGGVRQIAAPTQIDLSTMTGSVLSAPVTPTSWDLLPGEEGDRPRRDEIDDVATIPLLDPADVAIVPVPVAGSTGNAVRIEATFPAPPGDAYGYEFYYSPDGGASWRAMAVDLTALTASSEVVDSGGTYQVRWRTTTSGGNFSDYSDPVSLSASAHFTADSTTITADSTTFTADQG